MQLRTLALLCSIVGFLYSGLASALGLGEITLKSQYNQPLNAEIRLLKVRDLSEEEILSGLASRDDFRRAGVDRVFFLTGLNFEVVLDNPSNPFIRVTTRKPVTEPYLNFLVEVQWPSGRLLREYTLLLDLPVFTQASPANTTVTAPATTRSQPAPAQPRVQSSSSRPVVSGPAPVTTSSAPTTTNRSNAQFSQAPVDSYRVQSGDTLWEIAERVRPNSSTSVHQTMIALQQANPDAFAGGNINRLKNGRVLRVPSSDEIGEVSYNQAVSAVRKQHQSWSSKTNTKAVLTSAAPTTTTSSSASQPEGRLTLGAADSGQGDVRGAGASGSGESLQNELAIAKDELSRSTRENGELQSRVAELESQIETMEKLVQVTNDQLKALQLAAQNNGEQAPADVGTDQLAGAVTDSVDAANPDALSTDTASTEGLDTNTITDSVETPTIEAPVVEQPIVEPTPEPVVVAPTPTPPVVTPPAEEKFDLLGIIKSNLLAVGGGLLALLIGILVLLRLREKPEEADYGEFDLAEEEDLFDADELDENDLVDEASLDVNDSDDEDIEAQTEDVVAEADIYVSLGQEDKAIELLQKEIQQNPDNADARLGLLKIYAKAQNAAAFDEQYAQLLPLGNVYANDQAMALRKDISDVEPFDTDQYSTEVESEDAFDSLGLGDDDPSDDLDLDLNLDLDEEVNSLTSGTDTFTESVDLDSDLDLDTELDVDLGDLSIDLDDMDDSLGELSIDGDDDGLSLSGIEDGLGDAGLELDSELDLDAALDLDGDLGSELTLDEDIELELDTDDSFNLVDEMSADLDKLDTDDIAGDDLELSIDGELDSALGSLDEDISLDTDSLQSEDESAASGDMEFDLDFESADASLDDELNLDAPPPEDLDLASLDEEIDAMTADLDETLPLDKEEPEIVEDDNNEVEGLALDDPFDGSDLDLNEELEIELDESELVIDEEMDIELDSLAASAEDSLDDLASSAEAEVNALDDESLDNDQALEIESLEESAEADLDILASSEMDELTSSEEDIAEISIEDLETDDIKVSSVMDEATISEDEELDFLEASDEVSTKLDLAKAYIDMGDREGAEDILNEVVEEGNAEQKTEAEELKRSL